MQGINPRTETKFIHNSRYSWDGGRSRICLNPGGNARMQGLYRSNFSSETLDQKPDKREGKSLNFELQPSVCGFYAEVSFSTKNLLIY